MDLPEPISKSDVAFFRKTGLALVTLTLMAGAITLSLTVSESRSILLAQDAQMKVPIQLAAAAQE